MLADLPNLQSVALRFDKHCAVDPLYSNKPQTELYRATVMEWLFAELASLRRPLKELGIQNYQNVAPPPGTTSDQINQVLSTLTSLRLNVVHARDEAAPENDIDVRRCLFPLIPTTHADLMILRLTERRAASVLYTRTANTLAEALDGIAPKAFPLL
jgi:hypothetical protein